MKKANMIIIGMILVILILLLGCKNNEGFAELGRDPATGLPTEFGTVNLDTIKDNKSIVTIGSSGFDTDKVLFNLPTDVTAVNSAIAAAAATTIVAKEKASYCAFIDTGIVALNSLKIAKKNGTEWRVIWSSELSDPLWTGTSVTFAAATDTALAKIMIVDKTIGNGGTTTNAPSASVGTSAKLTNNGDLVIVKTVNGGEVTLWSLASHELKSTKTRLNEYLNRGSRIYASTELESLKKKLTNFSKYITAIAPIDTESNAELKNAHAMIVQARHQMDFDLSELNGVANSKVVSSQNGLNSSLYANLMATTLVAGLFILIATR